MVYLTYYEEYPIFEPAEGGYYYSGNQVCTYERLSKRAAKKKIKQLYDELKADDSEPDSRYPGAPILRGSYDKWELINNNRLERRSSYIGQGMSYVIERKLGRETRGYEPYC